MNDNTQKDMSKRILAETERELNLSLLRNEDPVAEYNRLVDALRLMENDRLIKNEIDLESVGLPIPSRQIWQPRMAAKMSLFAKGYPFEWGAVP